MRKNTLASTASSFAIAALSASAFIFGMPVTAQATAYCITGAADCTASNSGTKVATGGSQALAAGDTGAYETNGTFSVANGVTAGAVSTIVASTTTGTGTLTVAPTGGATGVGAVGSSTNYIGTVGVTGGAIGNTAAFSGVVNANALNVTTGTATVAGTAKVNTATLTTGVLTLNGATNTIGTLGSNTGSTTNINGTTTVTTLNAASGSTVNVGAATTITTVGTGAGKVNVTAANVATLTNGVSGAHSFGFTSTGNTGATASKITTTGANNLNLSGSAVTFDATNTTGGANKTLYTVASITATPTGTITGPSSFAFTNGVTGDSYYFRTSADGHTGSVAQLIDADYQSAATNTSGNGGTAANRAATSAYLESAIAGGAADTGAMGTYLSNLVAANVANTTTSHAAAGVILDQAGAQSTVQVANNLASDFMNVISDRTGVLQGTHTASAGKDGISAGDVAAGKAVWFEAFGSLGRQDSRGGSAGFDTQNGGFAAGAEEKVGANSVAGISISYGAGNYQSNEAGAPKTTTSDDYQASIYGSSYVQPNWYIDGQIGGGYHAFEEGNTFVGVGSTAADYHGWGYFGQVSTGYDFHTSSPAVITPFAKLAYQALDSDDYTETGTAGLTRHISSDTAQTLTGFLGAKVAWQNMTWGSTKITPLLRAAYFHDFEQDGLSTSANFTGTGSAATFSNTGANLAKDGFTVGAGLTAARANGWNFDLNYDYEGRDGYNGHSGTIEAKYAF